MEMDSYYFLEGYTICFLIVMLSFAITKNKKGYYYSFLYMLFTISLAVILVETYVFMAMYIEREGLLISTSILDTISNGLSVVGILILVFPFVPMVETVIRKSLSHKNVAQ
jgi:hypothetical protein